MPKPARSGYGLIAAPPVVWRSVPRPASRIGPRTARAAATAPRMLNSIGPRTSSTVVSRMGFMNSGAGSGEYSSTSTAPSRSASDAMAAASASLSRMSAAAPAAVMPSDSSCAARSSSLACVRETSPTARPSRPKRRAMARPRFGPAPTMTIDIAPRLVPRSARLDEQPPGQREHGAVTVEDGGAGVALAAVDTQRPRHDDMLLPHRDGSVDPHLQTHEEAEHRPV